jgi:hypothetical protein
VHGRKGEHLAVGRLQESTHVFAPNLETSACNAGDHIVGLPSFIAEGTQPLDP